MARGSHDAGSHLRRARATLPSGGASGGVSSSTVRERHTKRCAVSRDVPLGSKMCTTAESATPWRRFSGSGTRMVGSSVMPEDATVVANDNHHSCERSAADGHAMGSDERGPSARVMTKYW